MTTNNHPAHGPVSLDRLRQIREILSKAAAQSDGGNLDYAMADAVKVINAVLEARNAEPVVKCVPLGDSPYDVPHSMPSNLRELIAEEIGILFSDDDAQAVWSVCRRAAMLQAGNSPVTPDGWIPVSERMPDPKRWLALYGQRVFTHGNNIGKPCEEPCVDQGYLGSDGKFYLLNWDYPGDIDDNSNNMPAIATHWMYWEMPAAPQQEVKGE
ncbi:DUF551 domain-containing protein [Citrobacter freundii]|uniref:DUF551 domain-containing protein n=1 Tax=Citrobacter freundii TaxID=546 RepID=UPI00374F475D